MNVRSSLTWLCVGSSLVFGLTSCGDPDEPTARATAAPEPVATIALQADVTSHWPTVEIVTEPTKVSPSLPVELRPFDGPVPALDVEKAFAAISADPAAGRFFSDPDVVLAAHVQAGMMYELDEHGEENDAISAYPAMVISGGQSTCFSDGPPGSENTGPVPCTTLVIVNIETGEIPRIGEIPSPVGP